MKLPFFLVRLLLAVLPCGLLHAQAPPPKGGRLPAGVMTAAATTVDPAGRPMAYVTMISPQPETLRGRTFSVHLKPAGANAAGEFSLQGVMEPVTSPAVATALMDRAVRLGQDRAELERAVRYLYRKAKYPDYLSSIHDPPLPGDPPWPDAPAQPGEPPLGEQAVMIMGRAVQDAELTQDLDMTSLVSPGMAMLYGRGWGGVLPAAGQMVTLELRLRENGIDGPVTGRVELQAGVPLKLPAPGAPVQVPDRSPAGHLAIGLRWASPANLRRLSLLGHGFKVYRVEREAAELLDLHLTPPDASTLESMVTQMPGVAIRLSNALHLPPKVFLEENVADFSEGPRGDSSTTFLVDRNERCCGQMDDPPLFVDGARYYYFAVACDLLGQPGFVSPAGLTMACATVTPLPPNAAGATVNTVAATPSVTVEWVYRIGEKTPPTRFEILRGVTAGDPRISVANAVNSSVDLMGVDPSKLKAIASQSTTPGSVGGPPPLENNTPYAAGRKFRLTWTDPNPPMQPGQSCWYAVRAVYAGACGDLFSDPTAGSYVSLARANAPAPAELCYQGNGFPFAVVKGSVEHPVAFVYPKTEYRANLTCVRENTGISHVKFELRNVEISTPLWEQTVFFANTGTSGNNTIGTVLVVPVEGTNLGRPFIQCTAYSDAGAVSQPASVLVAFPTDTNGATKTTHPAVVFTAGAYSLASLPGPASALRSAVVGSTSVTATATAVPGRGHAMAMVNFGVLPVPSAGEDPVPSVLVEVATPTGWQEAGGARLSNGMVIVPREFTGGIRTTLLKVSPPAGCEGMAHQRDAAGGSVLPVTLGLCLSQNTEEYRVYRQVGQEEPRLIQQGAAKFGSGTLTLADTALPAVAAEVQYFAQLVDGDGNASPMKPLLACPLKIVTRPAVPVLQKLRGSGLSEMKVEWHCAAPGVERFQVFVETAKGIHSNVVRAVPQAMLSAILGQNPVPGPAPGAGGVSSSGLTTAAISGSTAHQLNPALVNLLEGRNFNTVSYYTPRIGPLVPAQNPPLTLGTGPVYSLKVPMTAAGKCKVWVKAISPTGGVSAPSNVLEFTWTSPPVTYPTPEPRAAWPARALPEAIPGTAFTVPVSVVEIPYGETSVRPTCAWPDNTGERYLRGVVIGSTLASSKDYHFRTSPRRLAFSAGDLMGGRKNPNLHLSGLTGIPGDRVLPAVLYRRQVPSDEFPQANGDVVQVSPLITNIANVAVGATIHPTFNVSNANVIVDPFIGVLGQHAGSEAYHSFTFCILDTHPAIEGAAYQYFLVRFDDLGEMRDVIEAGTTIIEP